jgi:hypothetical protein
MMLPDMQRLVSCCPILQQVSLSLSVLHTPELLAPLCSLTGLHRLRVVLEDDRGFGVLQQMMTCLAQGGVCGLHKGHDPVKDAGLLQLTALQLLSHLKFLGLGRHEGVHKQGQLAARWCNTDQLLMLLQLQGVLPHQHRRKAI